MKNPFFEEFSTPFKTIPFEEIKLEHYKPAIERAIELAKEEIEAIKQNNNPATFSNTIEKLERSGKMLDTVSSVFFNLNSAETSDKMQELAQEISPILTKYSNDIMLDELLFKKIKEAYENTNKEELSSEQLTLLENTYKGFVRSGANLSEKDKEKLRDINTQLSKLTLKFGENLLKDSNAFVFHTTNKEDLDGLPESVVEAASMMAKAKGKDEGWAFTLDYPSYIPFMQYSKNRALRKKLFLAFGSRAFQKNEYNNEKIVKEIAELRIKKANLLGYKTHADFVLEERMAKSPKNVYDLWNELLEKALPLAKEELKQIEEIAKKDGIDKLERWDFSYYSEKLKKQLFDINDELLKPYFQLEKVIDGAFKTAEKLYGITFVERNDIQKYHEDVKTFEVLENGNHKAILYADFFPREGKRNGAWMTSYRGQNKYDGKNNRPLISIVCNFTKPTTTKPSLLTFDEVTTLFHEFGHALHGILADTYYESLSGTSVFWDFVELPSQLMENWCYEKECLDLFAAHFETGEKIPMELVQKIKDSANFLSAYQTVRQTSLGQLDFAWHNLSELPNKSVNEIETEAGKQTQLFQPIKETNTSCAFSHIFNGGYSAGYYSYKWAEVLEADAFEFFKENGIFDKKTANKFKENVLSKGGSEHPMDLYIKFRGKKPSTEPLLRKSGLIK